MVIRGNTWQLCGNSVAIKTMLLPRLNDYITNSYLLRGNSGNKILKLFYVSVAKAAAFYHFFKFRK